MGLTREVSGEVCERPPRVDRNATKPHMSDSEVERLGKALEDWRNLGDAFGYGFSDERPAGRGFFGNSLPLWLYVLVNTSMRKREAMSLQRGYMDFEENPITVQGEKARSAQTRRISISKKLRGEFIDWYKEAHDEEPADDGDAVLDEPEPGEKVFPVNSFRKPWVRLREMTSLGDEFTPHLLRHHYALTLVNRGVSIPQVAAPLRHADLATTQRYLGVRPEDLLETVDLL